MGRILLALALHDLYAGANFVILQVEPELVAQHGAELGLVIEMPPVRSSRRMAHRYAPIKHCDARSIGARPSGDDVTLVGRIRMRAGIPTGDLVLTVALGYGMTR